MRFGAAPRERRRRSCARMGATVRPASRNRKRASHILRALPSWSPPLLAAAVIGIVAALLILAAHARATMPKEGRLRIATANRGDGLVDRVLKAG
jgi:hypothetical protein